MTIAEVVRETKGFYYRHQLEQSNFREVVWMLAMVNRDPKKAIPSKAKMWPIPAVDDAAKEDQEHQKDLGRALLDHYKKIGKI